MVIQLLQAHREFQIVTPRTLAAFRGSTLILPDVRVLGDDERDALRAQVSRGTRADRHRHGRDGLSLGACGVFRSAPGSAYLDASRRTSRRRSVGGRRDQGAPGSGGPRGRVAVGRDRHRASRTGSCTSSSRISRASSAGQNAVQTPQKGIRVSIPAAGTGKAWFLPFLGEAVEIQGQRQNGRLVFVLPDVQKGAVVWFDGDMSID